MTRDEQKRAVAEAALDFLTPGDTVGVGTGSTAALFIDQLAAHPELVAAAVPSSEATAAALRDAGGPNADWPAVERLLNESYAALRRGVGM